ncbi:MAG: N-acetyltransferase family protein [Candidatus Izemoplasmatales bacterium]
MNEFTIVKAERKDVKSIYNCIVGLAEYEKLLDQIDMNEAQLEHAIFDLHEAMVVLGKEEDNVVGFALYFYNFSTFKAKKGLYLEDLFIFPKYRQKGYGKKLFLYLIEQAVQEGCRRMEWSCLDWNQPAIDFYHSLGATRLEDWSIFRIDEKTLQLYKQNSR